MVVSELLEHLEHLDVRLSLTSEGGLDYDGPASVVNEELLGQLREHKPEFLQLLNTPTLTDALEGVELAQVSLLAEDVLTMPLKDFAESRLLLEVYSQALQERVLFAGDRAHVDAGRCRELTLYRGSELLELCGVDAPNLRVIHDAKKVFGGQVVT